MSDLISRSKLIDALKVHFDSCFREDGELLYSDHICTSDDVVDLIKLVENQPTTYSVDKVVGKLEELKTIKGSMKTVTCRKWDYGTVNRAIEIVKQGGVGTETETIRDKAVKWNNNSSKRVPYEFIDYVEGKRGIGVSDDVCEWIKQYKTYDWKPSCETNSVYNVAGVGWFKYCPYCGKKIKVVK